LKADLIIPEELVDEIADRVIHKLKPILVDTCNKNSDDILTINEASALLKVSKEQIYQWVSNSKHGLSDFPYKKLGKQLRFSKKDF
jgi:excisionase family DNA binding protein